MTHTHSEPPGDQEPPEDLLTTLRRGALGTLIERMGIDLIEATPERLVATMPVAGNTQPYGLLHGGASVVLAETLGSYGAALYAAPERQALGVEINATHHRSASSGLVTGTAVAIHLGSTAATYEIVVVDSASRRLCTARLTCVLIEPRS